MATDKQEILQKEIPTGKDVGKLLLLSATNLVSDIDLVEQSEYQRSVDKLTDEKEIAEFLLYRAWYDILIHAKTYTGGLLQQMGKGFSIINEALTKAKIAENEEIENEQSPLCMTMEEYEAYKADKPLKEYRYNERQRIEQSGICVAAMVKENRIDEKNCFINFFNTSAQPFSLLAIIQDDYTVAHLNNTYNNIVGYPIGYFYSYNKIIDIVAEVAEVEEVKLLKVDMKPIEKSCGLINDSIKDLSKNKHGNDDLQKAKDEIIYSVFPMFNLQDFKPRKARKELKDKIAITFKSENLDFFSFTELVESEMNWGRIDE